MSRMEPVEINRHEGSKLLQSKWWPKKQVATNIFGPRKCSGKLIPEELHTKLSQAQIKTILIHDLQNPSKTGFGGTGKTVFVKWWANKYEYEFDYILHIDFMKESLFSIFNKLAMNLQVGHTNQATARDLALKCFELLEPFKCLWIYDHVEMLEEEENLLNIIPQCSRSKQLIISRNHCLPTSFYEKEDVDSFAIDCFSCVEGLQFLKENIMDEITYNENQLVEICQLLGYHPLALHLAVTALNIRREDLETYIEQLKLKDAEEDNPLILNNYEKYVCKAFKTSLAKILTEINGKSAYNILVVFSYLRSCDIEQRFFNGILNLREEEIKESINLLCLYGLITKVGMTTKISTNRFFQQILRHLEEKSEQENLMKIMEYYRFSEYKLFPFTKYATLNLQSKFPQVWILLLKKLLKERRLNEALKLAKNVHEEVKSNTSFYNYIVCLEKLGELEETVKLLEEMYENDKLEGTMTSNFYKETDLIEMGRLHDFVQTGIVKLNVDVAKDLVGGHLMITYWRLGNKTKVKEILKSNNNITAVYSKESLNALVEILDYNPLNSKYCLRFDQCRGIRLNFVGDVKMVECGECSIDCNIRFPKELQELCLRNFNVTDEYNRKTVMHDISNSIPRRLTTLILERGSCSLSLEMLQCVEKLILEGCSIILDSGCRIRPKELRLFWVSFVQNGIPTKEVLVNNFLTFDRMEKMELICYEKLSRLMRIDLSDESVQMKSLALNEMKIANWAEAKWTIEKLHLMETPFLEETGLKVTELKTEFSSLDLSHLPQRIERLIFSRQTKWSCSKSIYLPNLTKLTISKIDCSILSHFSNCENLTHISFYDIEGININLLPRSVNNVEISGSKLENVPGERLLDTLVIAHCSADEVSIILSHLHPKRYFKLDYCRVGDLELSEDLQELHLANVRFTDKKGEKISSCDISGKMPVNLKSLTVTCGYDMTRCIFSLKHLSSIIDSINLYKCSIILDGCSRLYCRQLRLVDVSFSRVRENAILEMVTINEFVDLSILQKLELSCNESRKNICIDLTGYLFSSDHFELTNILVIKK